MHCKVVISGTFELFDGSHEGKLIITVGEEA
jgi:hypothetical protein